MQSNTYNVTIFLLVTTFLIMLMGVFIMSMIFLHRRKQLSYQTKIKEIEENFEKTLLTAQLEIQEQTFNHISREIHDNIGLSLTLAKLYLHTLPNGEIAKDSDKIIRAIELIGKSITELTDISQSLNADLIIQHGILRALEDEIGRIKKAGLFEFHYEIVGTPVYMDSHKELIIFRILQESFNNILKHAKAENVKLKVAYSHENICISISDDGRGFDKVIAENKRQSGLKNMMNRAQSLNGKMVMDSKIDYGTTLIFEIPYA